ncbi:MAG: dihydropteroate synthase [Myxococcota bacterium]
MLNPRHLAQILQANGEALEHEVPGFELGGRELRFDRTHLVGVINLSTDSWYKESVCRTSEEAVTRGLQLMRNGASIIDIGAESTLPDAARRDAEQQVGMLLPVVEPLVKAGALVSVESYRPEVLLRCAEAGAQVFNLTGIKEADEVFDLAARFGAAVILCYIQGANPREVESFERSEDMVPILEDYFRGLLGRAEARGVHKCFVDPGLGFYYKNLQDSGERVSHQIRTFLHAFRMWRLGKPVFNVLPHAPEAFGAEERRAAEPFFAVLAALGGTHVLRTHEVFKVRRVLDALEMYRS